MEEGRVFRLYKGYAEETTDIQAPHTITVDNILREYRRDYIEHGAKEITAVPKHGIRDHENQLAKVARQIEQHWYQLYTFGGGTTTDGYIITDQDMSEIDSILASNLLTHLKHEFPEEFKDIGDWTELLRDPINEKCIHVLKVVQHRKTFISTCEICASWVQGETHEL